MCVQSINQLACVANIMLLFNFNGSQIAVNNLFIAVSVWWMLILAISYVIESFKLKVTVLQRIYENNYYKSNAISYRSGY